MVFIQRATVVLALVFGCLSVEGLAPPPPPAKAAKPVTLKINTTEKNLRNQTAPLLHGLFFEDINHSGDGGLYAELIRNRAFQGAEQTELKEDYGKTLVAWKGIGGAILSLDSNNPLSEALDVVLKVEIPANATGEVGILNEGWWGIDIRPQNYTASFYIKPAAATNATKITASLRSDLTPDVFIRTDIPIDATTLSTTAYTQLHTTLTPTVKAPNSNNTFGLTFDGAEVAGQTFYFQLVSLFPPTYKNRKNGLRVDLAQNLVDLKPKFLRFPGGNNLEGISFETRWQWKKNIGDLKDRAGRVGNWGYFNTDGLGYLEYLEWCEDLELEPLLTVYAGYSLDLSGVQPAHTVPKEEIGFYIQEAIDQLEYAMGDNTTYWGKKRAEHGHPEPFSIKYVEIGNEDWFSDSYPWRFPMFYDALKKAYPDIIYISSQATENSPANQNITIPPGEMWDLHHYQTPKFYKDNFNFFDNWQEDAGYPNVTIFVGEFSVLSRDTVDGGVDWVNGVGRFVYPTMVAAIGEAIFALAMERNPHVVKLSSYAPLFQNFNAYQWTPDLIGFTATPEDTVLSTSYYQSQMFASYRGTETLPIINTKGDFNPLWWAATIEETVGGRKIYVKLVNASKEKVPLTLDLDTEITAANATYLSHHDEYGFNYIGNATAISPKTTTIKVPGANKKGVKKFKWDVPALSVSVLELR